MSEKIVDKISKSNQVIVVRRNAPNWPAMVSANRKSQAMTLNQQRAVVKFAENFNNSQSELVVDKPEVSEESTKQRLLANSRLRSQNAGLKQPHFAAKLNNRESTSSMSAVGIESMLLRQCPSCQVLYASCHVCT